MSAVNNLKFKGNTVLNIKYNGLTVEVCRINQNLIFAPDGFIDINTYLDACADIEDYLIKNSKETNTLNKLYDAAIKLADMGRSLNSNYTTTACNAIYGLPLGLSTSDMETVTTAHATLFNKGTAGITIQLLNNDVIDISHFWAALEGYIRRNFNVESSVDTTYPNAGSWLGDTITMAADIKNGKTGASITFRNSASKFSIEDWNSDLDGINIGGLLLMNGNMKLTDIMKKYFSVGLTESYRIDTFLSINTSIDFAYSTAKLKESTAVLAAEYNYGLITAANAAAGTFDSTYVPLVISLIRTYIKSVTG